jgi:SHS2 domain-containing protein
MNRRASHFRELDHTADLAIEVWGEDFPSLLAHAAEAMFALQGLPRAADQAVRRRVELDAPDGETLLVDWLNELLYLSETHDELYTAFEVAEASGTGVALRATVFGQKGHPTKRKIKAATFHDLRILEDSGELRTRIVFDV